MISLTVDVDLMVPTLPFYTSTGDWSVIIDFSSIEYCCVAILQLIEDRELSLYEAASTMRAAPCPTPTHIVAKP